jgi:hypothetical protein
MTLRSLLAILWLTAACGATIPDETAACRLAAELDFCPECYTGDVTCTFDGTSTTQGSCGDCQARSELYRILCAAGDRSSEAEILDETVCEDAPVGGACGLAQRYASCDECYDGDVTCSWGDFSATAASCGECQARGALYRQLCEAEVPGEAALIEDETVCFTAP